MSWVARLVLSPVRIFFLLVIGLVLAILVDIAIAQTKADLVGFKPAAARIVAERHVFFSAFDTPFLLFDPRTSAQQLNALVQHVAQAAQTWPSSKNRFANRLRSHLVDNLNTVLPVVEVFSLRVLSLAATLPVIVIFCLVASVDGWVRREVRKAGAGVESARIYHFAKRSIKPLVLWVSLLYLTLPVSIDVRWAYGILVVSVPLLLGISISRFKKYI